MGLEVNSLKRRLIGLGTAFFVATVFADVPKPGDVVELQQMLNARSSKDFRSQTRNVITQLPRGTRGRVKQARLLESGNYGLELEIQNHDSVKNAWVYYRTDGPGIQLYNKRNVAVKTPVRADRAVFTKEQIVVTYQDGNDWKTAEIPTFSDGYKVRRDIPTSEGWIPVELNLRDGRPMVVFVREEDVANRAALGLNSAARKTDAGETQGRCEAVSAQRIAELLPQLRTNSSHSDFSPRPIRETCRSFNPVICGALNKVAGEGQWDLELFSYVKAVIQQESGHDPLAFRFEDRDYRDNSWTQDEWATYLSRKPASEAEEDSIKKFESSYGLMQIMYPTAAGEHHFGGAPEELFDPATGLEFGIRHLIEQLSRADRSRAPGTRWQKAASAYNTGAVSVEGGQLIAHDDYIAHVDEYKEFYQSSCGFKSPQEACQ